MNIIKIYKVTKYYAFGICSSVKFTNTRLFSHMTYTTGDIRNGTEIC